MNFLSVIIDLILLTIIGLFVFISAKRGFVRVAVEAVGIVAAIILTLTVCTPLANTTYDKMIEPRVLKTANSELENIIKGSGESTFDKLPDFVKDYINEAGGIDKIIEESQDLIPDDDVTKLPDSVKEYVRDFSQNAVKPIALNIISAVYSVIILTLSLIIVKILANVLNKSFSFSIVGKLNTALGGVCGFVKGVAFVFVICFVISLLLSVTENGIWIFNNETIEKTYIFKFLVSLGEF